MADGGKAAVVLSIGEMYVVTLMDGEEDDRDTVHAAMAGWELMRIMARVPDPMRTFTVTAPVQETSEEALRAYA